MPTIEQEIQKLKKLDEIPNSTIIAILTSILAGVEKMKEDMERLEARITENNGITTMFGNMKKIKGDRGDRGFVGPKGVTGTEGVPGPSGMDGRGLMGFKGEQGTEGKDGADGEAGKDGSPDEGKDIKEKLEGLKGEKRLDASAVKNIPGLSPHMRAMVRGASEAVRVENLTSSLDGSTKTFTVPTHSLALFCISSQSPFVFVKDTHFTTSGTVLTLTNNVEAPASDQSLLFTYII